MYRNTSYTRQISKKLKLQKNTREIYTHSGLDFFPSNFQFDKPVLLVSSEILKYFNTILLYKPFYYVVCSCEKPAQAHRNVQNSGIHQNNDARAAIQNTQNVMQSNAGMHADPRSFVEEKDLKKMNDKIIYFKDEFVEEVTDRGLDSILEYLIERYPDGNFGILNSQTLYSYLGERPEIMDIAFSIENKDIIDKLIKGTLSPEDIKYTSVDSFSHITNPNSDSTHYGINHGSSASSPTGNTGFVPFLGNLDFHYRSGRVSKGTLMISPLNNLEGEVVEKDKRTKVCGNNINRAMRGDEVYIENDRIVGIFKRKMRIIVGTLFKIEPFNELYGIGYVKPIDRKLPDVRVLTQLGTEYVLRKVVINVLEWSCDKLNPRGVIFKILGKNGNYEDEVEAILEHFSVDYFRDRWIDVISRLRTLTGNTVSSIKPGNDGLSPEQLGFDKFEFSVERAMKDVEANRRRDLRHLNTCSIDPKGCTDIDDALHCVRYKDYIEVGVHIADVSYYVQPDSILDLEARNRSTTVYLPDRRIDMLPPFLSADLCSLLENKDRAAFSCIWKFDYDFNVIDTDICRSLIRSRKAFSYEEAYQLIQSCADGSAGANKLGESIGILLEIATQLRNRRFESGALELNSQEIYIDSKKNIKVKESIPTHYLVEEFMLLANITVAKFILKNNQEYALLRKHPLPSTIELDLIDCTSSKTLNSSLRQLSMDQSTIIKRIITRSMQQALYFCSGESSDYYHYGLAIDIYTHFTSPIRRYPDIIVHRTLSYIIDNSRTITDEINIHPSTEGLITHSNIQCGSQIDGLKDYVNNRTCSFMNFRHRNSQGAGRMASELCLLMAIEEGTMNGSIVAVKNDGVVVFIKEYGIEGFIELSKESNNYQLFDIVKVTIRKDIEDYCLNRTIRISIVG